MKFTIGLILNLLLTVTCFAGSTDAMKYLPVQDGGRIKPYDTFSREALQLITGRQTFQGRPAVEIVTTWFLTPQAWDDKKIIEISHKGLKESLRLDVNEKYFASQDLVRNDRIGLLFQELANKVETKEKLDPYYQAVARLRNQIDLFMGIREGAAVRVAPQAGSEAANNQWVPLNKLDDNQRIKFSEISKAFVTALPNDVPGQSSQADQLKVAVDDFIKSSRESNPAAYADSKAIELEVHYNSFQPFQKTWIFYLLAALSLAFAWQSGRRQWYQAGWVFALIAFALHLYGFGLRIYLTGRPPVSNMYESVIWVSFGVVLFSIIFEAIQRKRFILLAGTSVAVLCLIVANSAPAILDRSLQPLEPVLRSNLWLTIHVLTITISYSAFFLAFALGDLALFYFLKGENERSEKVRSIVQSIYRAMQVGVVLLAAGTILGGVWADYSWGRFWGWDPKETWAFIALMGYLAVLHGRLVGLVREFGMAASAVITFSLVLMAWYGVNFVLGAGLHSYGFGAGGVEYVSGFVFLHLVFVGYVAFVRKQRAA